jgi:4-hydroxy-3-methylbut-2-enyl diphosphate reductase
LQLAGKVQQNHVGARCCDAQPTTSRQGELPMRIILAQPRGFCAGVVRAVDIVERALETYGAPVFVRHEIVHNRRVVETLQAKGARFVKELDEVPVGVVTVFSAHGVSRAVEAAAGARGLPVLDATCPLVSKVHAEGRRYTAQGRTLILIGHAGHPEVEGTLGQVDGEVHLVASAAAVEALPIPPDRPVAYVTQTTLSVDDTRAVIEALQRRFTDLVGPDTRDICYATQNRQTAVRELARQVDLLLVVGAANSSNSNRLQEIGAEQGIPCYLIPDASALRPEWLRGAQTVGVTAGASAPESLVQEVIAALGRHGPAEVSAMPGIVEDIQFKLPAALAGSGAAD